MQNGSGINFITETGNFGIEVKEKQPIEKYVIFVEKKEERKREK